MDFLTIWQMIGFVLLAAILGSFANVLVYRLPLQIFQDERDSDTSETLNIAWPSSHCPSCKTPLKWWHNIPLLSYMALRGRCAFCGVHIPSRYFWIELGSVLIAVICLWLYGVGWMAVAAFGFAYLLWVMIWIDAIYQLLPDVLTLGLLWLGLILRAYWMPSTLADAVFGAVLGYILLWLPYVIYLQWRGYAGLGLGDAKLLAAIGVWLGVVDVPYVLLLASVLGLLYGVGSWAKNHHSSTRLGQMRMAFGPFIALAAIIVPFINHEHILR